MSESSPLARGVIVDVYTRLLDAWNQRDASRFAELFTETGCAIGFDGSQMLGRAEIGAELARIFAHHRTATYVAKLRAVRPLDEHTGLLLAAVGMVPPGGTALNPAVNAMQSLVVAREAGEPRIALLQSTPAAFHGRPELAEQLTAELAEVVRSGTVVAGG